jgi:hypothetical protein
MRAARWLGGHDLYRSMCLILEPKGLLFSTAQTRGPEGAQKCPEIGLRGPSAPPKAVLLSSLIKPVASKLLRLSNYLLSLLHVF